MGIQYHKNIYVKILHGKYANKYGKAGRSDSDTDLVEIYPLNTKDRILCDGFVDIDVIKCPKQIKAIKALYESCNE